MNGRPIDQPPVAADHPAATILERSRVGNVEQIIYEYNGKKYLERRSYGPSRLDRLDERSKRRYDRLTKEFGLSEDQAHEILKILSLSVTHFNSTSHNDKAPPEIRDRFLTMNAVKTKSGLSVVLGDETPKLLEKVLKIDDGVTLLIPMKDFTVRHWLSQEPAVTLEDFPQP